jgi:flagellar biosynthesis protein FlhB
MLTFYFIASFLFSMFAITECLGNVWVEWSCENEIYDFDVSHLPFHKWILCKIFKSLMIICPIMFICTATLFTALIAGWIICPVVLVLNFNKYNPFAIWKKQHKPKGK